MRQGVHLPSWPVRPVGVSGLPGAVPQRITPNGNIYGCLHDFDPGMSMHGAIWYRDGSVASLTTAGGELSDLTVDVSMSMNNGATPGGHVIVGLFNDVRRHGVVVQDGVFSVYDMPSATIKLTAIRDINTPDSSSGRMSRNGPSRFPAESRRRRAGQSRRHRADEHHRHGDQFQRRDRGHVYYRHRHAWTWIHRCADSGRAMTPSVWVRPHSERTRDERNTSIRIEARRERRRHPRTRRDRTVMNFGRSCVLVDRLLRCWASDFHSRVSSIILDLD